MCDPFCYFRHEHHPIMTIGCFLYHKLVHQAHVAPTGYHIQIGSQSGLYALNQKFVIGTLSFTTVETRQLDIDMYPDANLAPLCRSQKSITEQQSDVHLHTRLTQWMHEPVYAFFLTPLSKSGQILWSLY